MSLAGRTVVNLTTGSPEQAREAAAWAAGHGFGYLDGAIMSTPPGAGSPASMFLYSGSPAAFAAHRETLAALGDPIGLGEDAGVVRRGAARHHVGHAGRLAARHGRTWSTRGGTGASTGGCPSCRRR